MKHKKHQEEPITKKIEPPVIRPISIETLYLDKSLLNKKRKVVKKKKPVVVQVDNFDYSKFVYDSLLIMKKQVYSELVKIPDEKDRPKKKASPFDFTFSFSYVVSTNYNFVGYTLAAKNICAVTNMTAKGLQSSYFIKGFEYKK